MIPVNIGWQLAVGSWQLALSERAISHLCHLHFERHQIRKEPGNGVCECDELVGTKKTFGKGQRKMEVAPYERPPFYNSFAKKYRKTIIMAAIWPSSANPKNGICQRGQSVDNWQ
jgi:hypothetical protein